MIAKLEEAPRNTSQNIDPTRNPQSKLEQQQMIIDKQQNHRLTTEKQEK